MTDQIISREQMRARGRAAFASGRSRDDHHMNLTSPAIAEWQAGWDEACQSSSHAVAALGK